MSGAFPGKEKRTSRGLAYQFRNPVPILQFDAIFWSLAPAARSKDEGAKMLTSWIYAVWLLSLVTAGIAFISILTASH